MEIISTLWSLVLNLWTLIGQLFELSVLHAMLIIWIVWWLAAVNWKKAWPVLARGAWAPVVLLVVVGALVWSRIAPSELAFLGLLSLPNFWWQLGVVSSLAGLALFCGWVQSYFNWSPPEISFDPPAVAHDPAHGAHH